MKSNIVLIGMSGAGKTTVGKALSYKLKMAFVDIDNYIEARNGMSISEIFEKYGEAHFRKLEAEATAYLSENYKNTIISTGGGAVLNADNMKMLKNNGVLIYLNRTVESILSTLNSGKRPLLAANPKKLYEMYEIRHPLYLKYADICISNNGDFNECLKNIVDAIKNRM